MADGDVVELNLTMEPVFVEANPHVTADAGRMALTCGPLVYCLEGVDNGEFLRSLLKSEVVRMARGETGAR